MKKKELIITIIALVLMVLALIFYPGKIPEPVLQPTQQPPITYLSSDECANRGGEIVNSCGLDDKVDPNTKCPDYKTNIGEVAGLRCVAICCAELPYLVK